MHGRQGAIAVVICLLLVLSIWLSDIVSAESTPVKAAPQAIVMLQDPMLPDVVMPDMTDILITRFTEPLSNWGNAVSISKPAQRQYLAEQEIAGLVEELRARRWRYVMSRLARIEPAIGQPKIDIPPEKTFQPFDLVDAQAPESELIQTAAVESVPKDVVPKDVVPKDVVQEPQILPVKQESEYRYDPIDGDNITVEGVLVPQRNTVISSSRDGKILQVNVDDGQTFKQGDVLVEYECRDLKAELAALEAETTLTQTRSTRGMKLFKLDIISDIERLDMLTEDVKADSQKKIIKARMEDCYIRADYDGRVVNRLANPGEYTRTDRVLMEVASLDNLEVEFLLPSKWLRWVNTGAPVTMSVFEADERYTGQIIRIHGEVDPVSQSIQMAARLDGYDLPLLPGMSGEVVVDIGAIRAAGIRGYLEGSMRRGE